MSPDSIFGDAIPKFFVFFFFFFLPRGGYPPFENPPSMSASNFGYY